MTALDRRQPAPGADRTTAEEVVRVEGRAGTSWRPDLEPVFRSEYPRVVAAAHRVVGSTGAAEDVAQDVFLAFARSTVPAEEARGWLTVAAVHTALNHVRGDRRRDARERRAADPATDPLVPDVADSADRAFEHARVRAALVRMPRQQATVLVLRHSGLSYAEIAAHTELSPGSVGTTLRRAEAALRQELTDAPH